LITTGTALLIIVTIASVGGYEREVALVIVALGIAKAFESISDVFYGLQQQCERMDRVGQSKLIRGPLSLLALGIGIWSTSRLIWGTVGLVVAWAVSLIAYDIPSGRRTLALQARHELQQLNNAARDTDIAPRWKTGTLANLAWLALPLGIVVTLDSLRTNIPRYFIAQYMGEYELGIFAAMAYMKQAGNMVVIALGLSACPRLAQLYQAEKKRGFRELLLKLVGIGGLLGGLAVLVAWAAGPQILALVYQPEYARFSDVFVLLMLASGIDYVATILDYGVNAARYFRVQTPLFVAVTGSVALVCFWLVPSIGLRGAALAVIVSTLVRLIGTLSIVLYALRALQLRTPGKERADI
jgi:O-antigen/teichoic acid export membrane protein